jgi:hypothetical protein
MILFLDFDGVLHPEPCFDEDKLFCLLPNFEEILREYPQVRVVISSTWRETRSIDMLREYFSIDVRHRVIGVTPSWKNHHELFDVIGYQRQTEVEAWLRNSDEPWTPWIAIDDKPFLFQPFLNNLVKTNSLTGFNEVAEERLHTLLKTLLPTR